MGGLYQCQHWHHQHQQQHQVLNIEWVTMSWKYLIRKSWTWRWWRLALSNTHRWAPTLRWKYKFQCRLLLRQLGSPTGDQKYLRDCSSKCHRHDFHCDGDEAHVKPVVSPTSKLDGAMLVVEGEPSDVNLAGGLQSEIFTQQRWERESPWKCPEECMCRCHLRSPPRWSGTFHRKPRSRCS